MKPQNELALIVAYYLSRTDKQGYLSLGYENFGQATEKIGQILGVKKNTVKNMRDEFDPYHQNNRIGWKRELRGSRKRVLEAFQETDETTLREIVKEILFNRDFKDSREYADIHMLFGESSVPNKKEKKSQPFVLRGPTGKKAELFFEEFFKKEQLPVAGILKDMRDQGCGYDFEIDSHGEKSFVEVKGLAAKDGGVLFTNKEWQTALKEGNNYFLVLVRGVANTPTVKIIQNPASRLGGKKNVYTTIQLNWVVSKKQLDSFL